MAFWNRRHDPVASDDLGNVVPVKITEPGGAKAVTASADVLTLVHEWGWPFASTYGHIYRRQPAVRTVVDFLARNIGGLNLKTYARLDNSDRQELDGHPLAVLLRNPEPSTTRFRFMRDTVADIAIYDRAYWRKLLTQSPRALIRIPPSRINRTNEDGALVYRGPDGKVIPRDQLVVFPGYNPDGEWNNEDGVSPLETLRRVLAEEWAAQQHRENMWKNAARQAGVIERPTEAPEWSDSARARFRTDWEATMSGGINAGRTGILEEGMKWNPAAFSPKDTDYIEGRKLTFDEVCREYGMSPQLFAGDSANANIESFHRHLYQDTFGWWMRMLQDEIELQLLPDLERIDSSARVMRGRIYIEFNLAEKLKGSFEEQGRTLTTAIGVPYMTVNEGRARLNLGRIDDEAFDLPIQPLNVMYGGQPAVTVPTEVPQPGTRSAKRKAAAPPGALRRRSAAAAHHTELFRRYFRAQRQAVEKKAAAFDMERWNGKLTGELYTARVVLARKTGQLAAAQLNGVYNEAQTLNFLQESARREAVAVNAKTAEALAAADDPALVFDVAMSSRAERLGLSTATAVIGFARAEAAKQSVAADGRQRTKTWVVTSAKSRHPEMNGETVNFDEPFSNSCQWPGDSTGDVDEVANCQCLLELN